MSTSVDTSPPKSWGTSDISLPPREEPDADGSAQGNDSTYSQILRSSAIIGGSSFLNLAIGMVRSKAMAVMLGPAGFGLMGAFTTIADLARSVAEMGINASGVRQIAESAGSGDLSRIARTITVLRRTAVVLGLCGAVLLVACAPTVANITFGDAQQTGAVALLSLAVLFRLVADGQGALLQGMRRIGDLAKVGVLGTLMGTVISILIVYFLREKGIALCLVAVAGASLLVSWWFSRRVQVGRVKLTLGDVGSEAGNLLRLGLAFMASGLMMLGAAYLVRLILIRQSGLIEAGLYQAAWTLGGMYVGFVLQAMGTDFYPRLVAAVSDNKECNRLVNEQAQVSMLLAAVGVTATLTFAPLVIAIFYSSAFLAAVETLRWICLGMALRVITWPIGYIIVARNERAIFFLTEFAWTVFNVGLTWFCVRQFGLRGAGIAFFGSYIFHGLLVYPITRWMTGFRWDATTRAIGLFFAIEIAAVFLGSLFLPPVWAAALGTLILIAVGAATLRTLLRLVPTHHLPKRVTAILLVAKLLP
jgi:PST family polysaccharide transporter